MTERQPALLFDLGGTLVDSVYQGLGGESASSEYAADTAEAFTAARPAHRGAWMRC
jgi:hypothetical protein